MSTLIVIRTIVIVNPKNKVNKNGSKVTKKKVTKMIIEDNWLPK